MVVFEYFDLLISGALFLVLAKLVHHVYFKPLSFYQQFTNPKYFLPFLDHSLTFVGPPEAMLPRMRKFCYSDPGKRTFAAGLGFGKPVLWVFHPEVSEKILRSNTHINKSFSYDILLPFLGRGLLINTGHKWRNRRKLLTPAFHFKILDNSTNGFCQVGIR